MSAIDFTSQIAELGRLIEALYVMIGQIRADKNTLIAKWDAVPPEAKALRIGPAEFLDCPVKYAPMTQIESHAASGGLVLVKVKRKKLLVPELFWAYVVKASAADNTMQVVRLDPVEGHTEECETIANAKTVTVACWFWATYGA